MVLTGQILDFLNSTLSTNGKQRIAIQFGAYAPFSSFFGFAGFLATGESWIPCDRDIRFVYGV